VFRDADIDLSVLPHLNEHDLQVCVFQHVACWLAAELTSNLCTDCPRFNACLTDYPLTSSQADKLQLLLCLACRSWALLTMSCVSGL
jgi:hypothetical protein